MSGCKHVTVYVFAGGTDGPGEESQGSAISTATTESVKKKGLVDVGDGERYFCFIAQFSSCYQILERMKRC
jgi:hypothetical protein